MIISNIRRFIIYILKARFLRDFYTLKIISIFFKYKINRIRINNNNEYINKTFLNYLIRNNIR